ncbi:MAG TPA: type II toxin-antitoxin system VapC family toxin [Candidatus Methylomirabilis sp.]|nr:type II toxin-antitoxin system VapC family toxin [Candidatus Methylomirabilis sp.]
MEESIYDTNRLIDAYRGRETLDGYTTILNLIEFPKAIDFDLRVLFPSKSDYHLALIISTDLIKIGKPIPAVDSVIAAVALNNKLKLVTKDKHFLMVKEIKKSFKVDVV